MQDRLCSIKYKDIDNNTDHIKNKRDRVFALVTDFNPALPNVNYILNKHKFIFDLDPEIKKAIDPDQIFASYRGVKTINDHLVHSKLKCDQPKHTEEAEIISGRCQCCKKQCVLCKNYLKESATFKSFHCSSIYSVNDIVDCNTSKVVHISYK